MTKKQREIWNAMIGWPPFRRAFERAAGRVGRCLAEQITEGDSHSCPLCKDEPRPPRRNLSGVSPMAYLSGKR